jgi:hypothetical protein
VNASDALRRVGYAEAAIVGELGVLRKTHLEGR